TQAALDGLLKRMEVVLSEQVQAVRVSRRLTSSPACLVVPEGGMHAHVERIVRRHTGGGDAPKRIFEVNPNHGIISSMNALHEADPESPRVRAWIEVLHGQALVAEGSPLADPARFAAHITTLLQEAAVTASQS
ncbi:MAG: molecular chaperone HtpG, partial [Myxococcota bacterium]|nr:molecular chaperone HtpG [Myxococcota bacterium]